MYHAVPTSIAAGLGGGTTAVAAGSAGLSTMSVIYLALAAFALIALAIAITRAALTFRR